MDFRIRRSPNELESTGFMEISPSRFSGKHWQEGSLFIWEDSFNVAEGIVAQHFPGFDHMAANDIPKSVGTAIVADWQAFAQRLTGLTADEAIVGLNLSSWFHGQFREELTEHRTEIGALLTELSRDCGQFYSQSEWVTIIGV